MIYLKSFNESLNSPVPIKWSENSKRIKGKFVINNNTYVIKAVKLENEDKLSYFFKFYWLDDIDIISSMTGFGKGQFKILSTVIDAFKHINSTKNPSSLCFCADLKEDSRIPVYNKLIKDYGSYGFKLDKFVYNGEDNLLFYILYKDPDKLQSIRDSLKLFANQSKLAMLKYL